MTSKTKHHHRIDIDAEQKVWLAIGVGAGMAREMGLADVDRVRIETVISEMAHNLFLHAGGGTITIEPVAANHRQGLRIQAKDTGPGMADVSQALLDGFSTQDSLGIGLGVTKRMMDDVAIRSHPGWGTIVTVTKWVRNGHHPTTSLENNAKVREQR